MGNVRAIITREDNAPQHHYLATMESANLTLEDQLFYNVSSTQASSPIALSTATSSTYGSLLNSGNEPIGPAKVLYLQEGDQVSINVQYYYEEFAGTNSTRDLNDILSQLANDYM